MCSSDLRREGQREQLQGGGVGELGYIGVLQQRVGSRNIKNYC